MRISPFTVAFLLLLSVPLLEIYLLISMGRVIGAGATILVVIVTAVLGAWLLRLQGLGTLARVQAASQAGQLPAVELVEGLILLVSGALLLTPGFFTDAIGFLSLVPSIRRRLAEGLLARVLRGHGTVVDVRTRGPQTIEGTYRREDPPES
ncbi:MAG: FxsA family protein [Gammaproteobacteria bacterium]|jgi:UPF0716 protein FxsA